MLALVGCAGKTGSHADSAAATGPKPTIWTLDSLTSIGGHSPEVLGSPRVLAAPDGPGMWFDGVDDGLVLPVNPIQGMSQFTIEMLFKPEPGGLAEQRFMHIQDNAATSRVLMETRLLGNAWALDTFLLSGQSQRPLLDTTKLHPADQWTWVALVYGDGKMAHYINGVKELEGDVNFAAMVDGKISLGVRQNKVYWYKGTIRQVRFSPVALAAEKLQRVR